MRTVQKLTLDDARVMMTAAEAKAQEIGVDMDIAITDDNGSLLMFHRMDGGRITSIDIAISKAFTGAAARKSTRAYGEVSGPGGPAFGIHVSNQGRFMIVAGGLPVSAARPPAACRCSSTSRSSPASGAAPAVRTRTR